MDFFQYRVSNSGFYFHLFEFFYTVKEFYQFSQFYKRTEKLQTV